MSTAVNTIRMHTSIGIAMAKSKTQTTEALMKQSDEAMYICKTNQTPDWCYQEEEVQNAVQSSQRLCWAALISSKVCCSCCFNFGSCLALINPN